MSDVSERTLSAETVQPDRSVPQGAPAPDVYFLPGYGRAAGIADGGEWVLLESFDGAWQVPLIVRALPDGAKDAISPTYSGVFASAYLSPLQIQEAWSATLTSLKELGIISVLLRSSPLVPQPPQLPGQRSIVKGRPTIVLNLADEESAWSGMKGSCRTWTRKALKHGYTAEVRAAASQDLVPDGDFRRLYEQTMQRRSAAPLYFFGENYYRALLDGVGTDLFIAEVRNQAGNAVSSTLLMRHGHRLHYHLAGSNVADARMGSNNLMLWTATQFAIAHGLRQFHLGSGVGLRDDLFKFKRSFGGREVAYDISGLVVDDERYQAQVENRARACDTTADALLASNYFPAYRAGTAHV